MTLIVFIAGVILINYFSHKFHHDFLSEGHRWMVNFAMMVIGSVIWAFAIRVLNIKSMVRILKYG